MTKLEGSFIQELLKRQGVNSNTVLNVMKKIRGNKKVDNKNAFYHQLKMIECISFYNTSNYFFLDSRRLNFERANTPRILTMIVTKRSVPAPSVGTNTRTRQPTNNGRMEILQYLRR